MFTDVKPTSDLENKYDSENKVIRELERAMSLKRIETVKELLGKLSKEDLTQQIGPLKLNILHKACSSCSDIEIVRIVAEKYQKTKVSLDIPDIKNFTALDKAFLLGKDLVAKALIRAGADYSRISAGSHETYLTNFLNKKTSEERIEFETFINSVEKEQYEAKKSSWGGLTYLYAYVTGKSSNAASEGNPDQVPETQRLLESVKSPKKKE